jgi:hypothetical protein
MLLHIIVKISVYQTSLELHLQIQTHYTFHTLELSEIRISLAPFLAL